MHFSHLFSTLLSLLSLRLVLASPTFLSRNKETLIIGTIGFQVAMDCWMDCMTGPQIAFCSDVGGDDDQNCRETLCMSTCRVEEKEGEKEGEEEEDIRRKIEKIEGLQKVEEEKSGSRMRVELRI